MTAVVVAAGAEPSALAEMAGLLGGTRYRIHMEPEWLSAYVTEFGVADSARILLVRESRNGPAIGALPLQEQHVRGTRWWNIRRLVPLGSGPSDFFDIPALPGRAPEVGKALAGWLAENRSLWDEVVVDLVPQSSSSWAPFVDGLQAEGLRPVVSQDNRFFRIDTTTGWDQYETAFLRPRLSDYNNVRNRIRRAGISLDFEVITSEVGARLRPLIDLYQQRRLSKGQRDAFVLHDSMKHFVFRVIDAFERRNWVRLTLLGANGAIWAFSLDWLQSGVWYQYMPAFDETFRKFSPGKLLLRENLRLVFGDSSLQEFNFMRGESTYKQQFASESECFVSIRIANPKSLRLAGTRLASEVASVRDGVFRRGQGRPASKS